MALPAKNNHYNSREYRLSAKSKGPLLTREQEIALGRAVKLGSKEAENELIERNLLLVISIAKKYLYRGLPLEDLIENGNIGLMRAVEDFDPENRAKERVRQIEEKTLKKLKAKVAKDNLQRSDF
jgi:DNA-directed RNA polymerase sigma subunit (sigma70/sigma32)